MTCEFAFDFPIWRISYRFD